MTAQGAGAGARERARCENGGYADVVVDTLDNGLRVASQHMPGLETVAVGVWVDSGARGEPAALNGISHLLEHMAFKGTRRRDAFAIAAEIEAVGGHLNAYTSREHTAYYARTLAEDLPLAVDLLGDILLESTFAEDELAREKDVIVQEIGQARDTPDDIVFDHFQEAAYPDQPIGRPVLGSPERVSALGAGALRDWLKSRYTAPRMVLSAAGAVDHERLCDLAGDSFAALPAGAAPQAPAARYGGGERRVDRDLEQLHLVLGCEGVSYDDEAFPALQVLSTLLGGGMSSRLFQEAREKRGLAYAISSFASSYVDGGLFGVYAGCAPGDAAALLDVVFREVAGVREGAGGDEIARAQAQLRAGILMSMESAFSRCERVARQLLIHGAPRSVAETVARIEAVDEAAVRACAERTLAGSRPTLAAIGPVADTPGYDAVAAGLA